MAAETNDWIQTVGRRKTSSARVLLRPGNGEWSINGRNLDDYFPRIAHQYSVEQPLAVTETQGQFEVMVRVKGGGITGQADAIKMGLARALVEYDEEHRAALRTKDLLTRDARKVERKKPGRPKARKRFQFSKR